jgi:hypothetical protein
LPKRQLSAPALYIEPSSWQKTRLVPRQLPARRFALTVLHLLVRLAVAEVVLTR